MYEPENIEMSVLIIISFLQYDFLKCVAGDLQNDKIGLGGFWVRKYYFIDTDGLI